MTVFDYMTGYWCPAHGFYWSLFTWALDSKECQYCGRIGRRVA